MDPFSFYRMGWIHVSVWLRERECPCFMFGWKDKEGIAWMPIFDPFVTVLWAPTVSLSTVLLPLPPIPILMGLCLVGHAARLAALQTLAWLHTMTKRATGRNRRLMPMTKDKLIHLFCGDRDASYMETIALVKWLCSSCLSTKHHKPWNNPISSRYPTLSLHATKHVLRATPTISF